MTANRWTNYWCDYMIFNVIHLYGHRRSLKGSPLDPTTNQVCEILEYY